MFQSQFFPLYSAIVSSSIIAKENKICHCFPLDSKEIKPEYSLEGLMLRLKVHYFGHLMQRANSLEKTLMLGKFEGRMRRGCRG